MARLATVALRAACALALFAPATGAHRFNAKTTAEIQEGSGPAGAYGFVYSPKRSCRGNRLVELFRVSDTEEPDQSYGTDRSDPSGNWRIVAPLIAGEYYVTVKKSRASSAAQRRKHSHKCKAGRSKRKQL